MNQTRNQFRCWAALLAIALTTLTFSTRAQAQDDDPPTRVARIGYMDGSVSFQPAGENEWVGAVPNRPMTTGDRLWTDQGSRAELQLGTAVIRLSENTGISFLNLDDNTVQLQLSSGSVSITVRRLRDNDYFEVDTPNLAFTVLQRGHFRLDASEDGNNTTISVREGDGQATGNGQSYDVHAGQIAYFTGGENLYADVEQIGGPDAFDAWCEGRDHRYDFSRSVRYLSPDVVGFEDLDDYGEWREDPGYGNIWFPNRIEAGWAPYHTGHWAWIDPWGYTWVDDSPWGYAPFHYGRWLFVGGRWGWIAGPATVEPVYAPALVVFVGGGGGWGGNIGWFPLGPREVYVPSYHVSATYMTQINVSSTTVNTTVITNVYNTTIVRNTTNITNVTYVNRTVPGAVVAVPQGAFTSAQPVARAAVAVNAQQIASAPVAARVTVNPTPAAVLGGRASTAGHVAAPPAAVMSRTVVAKKTPPPPPPSFAQRQQAMAAHPGQPLPPKQLASMAPPAAARPAVRVAPPAKPATPTTGRPPANVAARPGQPAPATQPANRPPTQPAPTAQPANRPPNQPAPAQPNRPAAQPSNQPAYRLPAAQPNQPANRPAPQPSQPANRPPAAQPNNRPETNRPAEAPARPPETQPNNRPPAAQPTNRPPAAQPNRPEENRPPATQSRPAPQNQPAARPAAPPAQQQRLPAAKPAPPPKNQPQTPEEKKREEKPQGE